MRRQCRKLARSGPASVNRRERGADNRAQVVLEDRQTESSGLVKLLGIGPGRKPGDDIESTQEITHHLAGVFPLAELLELPEDAREGVLGLGERMLGVVLPLSLETPMMLEKFLAEEIRKALTGRPVQRANTA